MANDAMVADYLAQLEAAAGGLPPDRRAELIAEVHEHIDLAVAEAGNADGATLQAILDRLGAPEEIVAAERDGETVGSTVERPVPWRPHASTETKALLLLTVGAVLLPFIGSLAGLWVAWSSDRWTRVQKRTASFSIIGLLLLPAAIVIPMLLSGEVTASVNNFGPIIALIPLSGLLTALYLAIVLNFDIVVVERRESLTRATAPIPAPRPRRPGFGR